MPRDKDTGKPKGFAFIAYEDQRSTVLAVDNFNGAKVLGRTLRCDHCLSFNEEQKKSADQLPDHLLRKLSDKQIEEKKREIERRNGELEAAAAEKEELFAHGRGTAEDEVEAGERRARAQIMHKKDSEASAKRMQHIEAVLAKRRGEYDKAKTEEQRKEKLYQERKRQREIEAGLVKPPPPPAGLPSLQHNGGAADGDDGLGALPQAVVESRFDRLMNGGKKKKRPKLFKDDRSESDDGGGSKEVDTAGGGAKDGISIEETNRIRQSLGLKPLRE